MQRILRGFFVPTVRLLNRVNYTKKFTLLWLLSLFAIAVVVQELYTDLDRVIQPSRRQLEGLLLFKPISQTVQALQLHRGTSAAVLGGDLTMEDLRAATEIKVVNALEAFEKKLPANLASDKNILHIKAEWQQLRNEGLGWNPEKNFAAHTRLLEQLDQFEVFVADKYLLTLDSNIVTYYLIDTAIRQLPHTLEHLGQLRAYGTSILANKKMTERQKIKLHTLIAELDSSLRELKNNMGKAGVHHPAVQDSTSSLFKDVALSTQQITNLVASDIITGNFATSPSIFMKVATAEIDKSYAQMYGTLLPATEALIKARIADAKNTMYMSIGIAVLGLMMIFYFSVCMYYSIIGAIRSLTHAARTFASGNLLERVQLTTNDELSLVGRSFNQMADGFTTMLEARREDEARLRATFETAMDAVVQMNAQGVIIGWNSQAEKIFGWAKEEAIGRRLHETIIPPQFREAYLQGLKRFLLTGDSPMLNLRTEVIGLHRGGREFPVELTVAPIKLSNKSDKYEFSAFIRDISKRKESDDLIWKQVNFDMLTGLPNRRMFYDRLTQEIKKAHRADLKIALLFIDLDKFKEVNDALGHSIGDIMLAETARRISACVRETDIVARLGGDEFTVVLSELSDTSDVERVAACILQKLVAPFQLGNEVTHVSASIGITLYPADATGVEDLVKNADQAMYAAKNKGRNRFGYFTPSMQYATQARLRLINELRVALTENQFSACYQPIIDLATGRINKAEALIRWQHPRLGLIKPAEFIHLAEETGMIVEIGDWIFKESARQLKRWRASHNADLQISVNVSPVQFNSADCLCGPWLAYLHELGLPSKSLVIEITEGLLLRAEFGATDKVIGFRDAGIQVAIDDFGTGYSALSYLKKLDIDYLKIDQSFVRDLVGNPDDMALCEAIIVMAHKLGLKVIAEGVETEAQRNLLRDADCDYAQGYLFSKPLQADMFEKMLEAK